MRGRSQRIDDTAVECLKAPFGLSTFYPCSTAVSAGQACALPLCHRTPRRCRYLSGIFVAEPKDRDILLRVLTDFLFQRPPHHTHSQLAMMMNLTPLEETEGYKSLIRDANTRGLLQCMIRIVPRRFPNVDATTLNAIGELDYLQLERLADSILDLPDVEALRIWLSKA